MTGAAHEKPARDGLGRMVAVLGVGVVVVGAAAVGFSRLFGDDGPALSEDELDAALLTEAEVGDAASAAGPYAPVPYEATVDGLMLDYELLEIVTGDQQGCREIVQRIFPGGRAPAAAAAFRREDNTIVLHTVDVVGDGMSVDEMADMSGRCNPYFATYPNPRAQLVGGVGHEIDGVGGSSVGARVEAQMILNGEPQQGRPYADVAMVERDGVVATLTVVGGEDLSDERGLAESLAVAVDDKLSLAVG